MVDGIKKPLTLKEEADRDAEEMRTANEKAIYAAEQYKRDRSSHYPSVGDQLDMIYHAGEGGDEFQAAIQAVKDAHPKPEEEE